ncbi:MAG TPA: hypothetical protein VF821_22250, partial [Lentzea sp.]
MSSHGNRVSQLPVRAVWIRYQPSSRWMRFCSGSTGSSTSVPSPRNPLTTNPRTPSVPNDTPIAVARRVLCDSCESRGSLTIRASNRWNTSTSGSNRNTSQIGACDTPSTPT